MDPVAQQQLETLLELDARHDDLLQRLDELDRRITTVLAEYAPPASASLSAAAKAAENPSRAAA
jgi:hypothetical protein